MDKEDRAVLRVLRNWTIGLFAGLLILGGVATIASRAFDLAWFPWEIQMKTGMIRASNSYVTTQQAQLRQLQQNYFSATTDAQKLAILHEMQETADLIPGYVQPDIAAFISAHLNQIRN